MDKQKLDNQVIEENNETEVKKKRVKRKDWTPEYRKHRRKKSWLTFGSIMGSIVLIIAIIAIIGVAGTGANIKKINAMEKVGASLVPATDVDTGNTTFYVDNAEDFKVLQLTDIHLGGGAFSLQKDSWAIDAVKTLVEENKPDLVIVTGDIAYPVPFQSGTFNNRREARVFATLMEQLEVYWAPVFGNHDTEMYSSYDRESIAEFYTDAQWKYCLFEEGDKDVDGFGNYVINVEEKDTNRIIHSFYLLDSHSYTDGDYFGAAWKYDNIHQNQVDWYKNEVARINKINIDNGFESVKSTMYFHIPLQEYLEAWTEYVDNDFQDTDDVKYNFGVAGEEGKVVYCGVKEDEMFDSIIEMGSTVGVFCGHDHLNNFSITYKGIKLTYGMSIDYLAYAGIQHKTEQRGGTVITVLNDSGNVEIAQSPYGVSIDK